VTKFLCVLCVLCGSASNVFSLDRHAFTFTRYDLNARIEPEQQRLGVRGKLTLRNDSGAPQKNLSLQISSTLHWSSIQFDGEPVEFVSQAYTSDIDHTGALTEAIVVLSRPVLPKQSIELEIGYEGTIPQDATRLTRIGVPAVTAKHSDWDQIGNTFTAVRGIGYVTWYPIATEAVSLSEGNSVFEEVGRWKQRGAQARFDVDLCTTRRVSGPPPVDLMNDSPQTEGHRGGYDGTTCSGHPFHPMRMLVPTFAIGDYLALNKPDVEVYYRPDHKSGAEDYSLAVEQVAPLVNKWFGDHREEPESKAEVIELPDPNAAPSESGNMLLMPFTDNETTLLLSAVRQLTHLCFPSPHAWISEGLAGYAQAGYFQEEKGRDAALAYLQSHRDALIQAEKESPSRENNRESEHSLINAADDFYVQSKAMNVWWMLNDMVGGTALSAALHNYKASDDKDAHYMQKLIETQSHRDLQWFFDDWVYHDRGLPDLRIASVYPRQLENGGQMVTVTVENLGDAGAEVPVTVHMTTGEATERLTVPRKSKVSVRIVAPTAPQEVNLNDGSVPESGTSNHVYKIEAEPNAK
jgi:hypothetical protein